MYCYPPATCQFPECTKAFVLVNNYYLYGVSWHSPSIYILISEPKVIHGIQIGFEAAFLESRV